VAVVTMCIVFTTRVSIKLQITSFYKVMTFIVRQLNVAVVGMIM